MNNEANPRGALFKMPKYQLRKYARQEAAFRANEAQKPFRPTPGLNSLDPPAPLAATPQDQIRPQSVGGPTRFNDLQWFLRKIQAPQAWEITRGNPQQIVAVIDSGLDYEHPSFQGRALKGFDFTDLDMDPSDSGSHGTHVAGIIGANDNNIQGVAPEVKLLAIKVFSATGFAEGEYVLPKAIRYATKHGASVINMSLGSSTLYDCGQYDEYIRALNSAIDEAVSQGVSVVTAMGNEGYGFVHGRCSVQQNLNQIPVVATDEMDRLSSFTNFSNLQHPKAISAPGVNIFSSVPRPVVCDEQSCQMPYDYMDGTSMAAPVVSGALALIRAAMYQDYVRVIQARQAQGRDEHLLSFHDFFHRNARYAKYQMSMALTPAEMSEQLLFSYTNNPGNQHPAGMIYEGSRDPLFGYGRINVGRAVDAASKIFTAAGV